MRDLRSLARDGVVHEACGKANELTECGQCYGVWCDRCDPAHGPLCPWCHGYGYSTAAILEPLYRQANHVADNGGRPIQESR